MRKPDFDQLLKVLHREEPDRPVLFEFFLNEATYDRFGGRDKHGVHLMGIAAAAALGYDHAPVFCDVLFPHKEMESQASYSLNDTVTICDRPSMAAYRWLDPDRFDYSYHRDAAKLLPSGMKLIAGGPGGVLENLIALTGFDNLCFMLADDYELVADIVEHIGTRLDRFYEHVLEYDTVGACIVNDDWGFNTQPMLAPDTMRALIVPWHRRFVERIHHAGRPAIMHSCGNLFSLMDDIIDDCRFDARHSYEDKIMPVEEFYEKFHHRIAILGGIDLDFLCRAEPEAIYQRSKAMLERTAGRGGYALGSGNSIAPYVPFDNFQAMTRAALEG